MARRPKRRRSTPDRDRPFSLASSHWRSDGRAKVRYGSQAEALSAADERAEEADVVLGVYQCDFCQGWHMGGRSDRDGR